MLYIEEHLVARGKTHVLPVLVEPSLVSVLQQCRCFSRRERPHLGPAVVMRPISYGLFGPGRVLRRRRDEGRRGCWSQSA